MTTRRFFQSITVVLFATALASAQNNDRAADKKVLEENREAAIALWNSGDAKAIAARYVPNASWIGWNGEETQGRKKIEALLTQLFEQNPNLKLSLSSVSTRFVGRNVAVEDGVWKVSGSAAGHPTEGRYTIVSNKRKGNWMTVCHRSMVPHNPQVAE